MTLDPGTVCTLTHTGAFFVTKNTGQPAFYGDLVVVLKVFARADSGVWSVNLLLSDGQTTALGSRLWHPHELLREVVEET